MRRGTAHHDGVVSDDAGAERPTTERYLSVHGHFYQPPRQHPWLEEIEAEPSAGQLTPGELEGIIRAHQREAKRLQCALNFGALQRAFEALIERHIALLSGDAESAQIPLQALEVAQALRLELDLWRGQNLFWHYLTGASHAVDRAVMLELGTRLGFNHAVVSKLLQANVPATQPADLAKPRA